MVSSAPGQPETVLGTVHQPDDGAPPPRWSLEAIFPGIGSEDFARARSAVLTDLQLLQADFGEYGVKDGPRQDANPEATALFDAMVEKTNSLLDRHRMISLYLSALLWADATDEAALREQLTFRIETRAVFALVDDLKAWTARFDGAQLVADSSVARAHAHFVRRAAQTALHRMPAAQETLYRSLRENSGVAWLRLYRELASAVGPYPLEGDSHGALADAGARHQDNVARWHSVGNSIAACLNAIKGEELLVSRARGWDSPLAERLDTEGIEAATLHAMFDAVRQILPDVRAFLRAKAQLLEHREALPWWGIPAFVPGARPIAWSDALDLVEGAFNSHSGDLGAFPRQALQRGWIDAEPRITKRSRALCVMIKDDEPRILLSYDGTYESVLSLAHELGHAYHYTQLTGATWLQRDIPLALSETASGYCEAIAGEALLYGSPADERLARLDAVLVRKCQSIVDTLVSFSFEDDVFRERALSPLTEERLCELMTKSQLSAYQDSVLRSSLHPYWWAARADTFASAYSSWQYCFGNLLGAALHTQASSARGTEHHVLDETLRRSGTQRLDYLMHSAGIDLVDPAFWEGSLAKMKEHIAEFVMAVGNEVS